MSTVFRSTSNSILNGLGIFLFRSSFLSANVWVYYNDKKSHWIWFFVLFAWFLCILFQHHNYNYCLLPCFVPCQQLDTYYSIQVFNLNESNEHEKNSKTWNKQLFDYKYHDIFQDFPNERKAFRNGTRNGTKYNRFAIIQMFHLFGRKALNGTDNARI